MNAPERVLGMDGKSYPRLLGAEDRARLAGRVHYLRHHDGLSVRQILAVLAEQHHVRRSVGWVAGILRRPCVKCSGGQDDHT